MNNKEIQKDHIRDQVRKRYAEIAESELSCCSGSSPLGNLGNALASAKLGYSSDEMNAVPDGSNMGLGCGNPNSIASLEEGETVLDLGCGGGFDCFLASPKVGQTGKVIGVDMTPEMLNKARANAEKSNYKNVEFRLGEIEHLPVADNSVDVIISNCVINLSPDKKQVYAEVYRVLKPGGRIAISDVVATRSLPDKVKDNSDNYCGCISGAITVTELEKILKNTGFEAIKISLKENSKLFIKDWFPGSGLEDYVIAAEIVAHKSNTNYLEVNMNEKNRELIAIGASVASHCQPCLTYHIGKAKELGIEKGEIAEAIEVGEMVQKGAYSKMKEFASALMEGEFSESGGCCPSSGSSGEKCCCK